MLEKSVYPLSQVSWQGFASPQQLVRLKRADGNDRHWTWSSPCETDPQAQPQEEQLNLYMLTGKHDTNQQETQEAICPKLLQWTASSAQVIPTAQISGATEACEVTKANLHGRLVATESLGRRVFRARTYISRRKCQQLITPRISQRNRDSHRVD